MNALPSFSVAGPLICLVALGALGAPATAAGVPEASAAAAKKRGSEAGGKERDGGKADRSGPAEAKVKMRLAGLRNGKTQIMSRVKVRGFLAPFVAGQRVDVTFYRNGRKVKTKRVRSRKGEGNFGRFEAVIRADRPGKWAASARHRANREQRGARTVRKSWRLNYPALRENQCGRVVIGFKKALRKMGYIANGGPCMRGKAMRGVLAYRKVNDMTRSFEASADLVKRVYLGKGGYRVRHPGADGVHVEAPLSKQVVVFAKGSKPIAIYPISSGKSSTPTVRGSFRFQWTEVGYNSLGMYYSWYFYGGYAIHGYHSVPNYPASHGCLRTFIADQPEIFNRISQGDQIFIW